MVSSNVFVTVGTTKFDDLIETITSDDILRAISRLGYDSITFQIGSGCYVPTHSNIIHVNYYRFKNSIKDDIQNAKLVISHAGAGSCLEVLNEHKPLIVVINENLMGNHQLEIARALSKRKFLQYCTCSELRDVLIKKGYNDLKPYPSGDSNKFVDYLNKCVGFTNYE